MDPEIEKLWNSNFPEALVFTLAYLIVVLVFGLSFIKRPKKKGGGHA